jgi:hypothetical protein
MNALRAIINFIAGQKRDGAWHHYSPYFRRSGMPEPHPHAGLMRRWHNGAWEYRALTDDELAEEAERQIESVL